MESSRPFIGLLFMFMNIKIQSSALQPVMYGQVQSPFYPEHSSTSDQKHWDLKVPQGYQIKINFNYLNIKPSQDCRNNSLEIFHHGQLMKKYCGERNSGNDSVLVPSSNVQLSFLANEIIKGPNLPIGFSAFYQAVDVDECSSLGSNPLCSQICINTLGSYLCACHHGFRLEPDQHSCVGIQCESPKHVNGRISPAASVYYYKNQTTLHCDKGYTIITDGGEVSSYTFTCQANGQWSSPRPQCTIIQCEDPPSLLNGEVSLISGARNQYGSVIKLHCNEVYALPGGQNGTYTCNSDKKWKDEHSKVIPVASKCVPVCGRPAAALSRRRRVVGGQQAAERIFPWHVLMRRPSRGGGAIIAEQWILTAASNLDSDNQPVEIYIGGTDARKLFFKPSLQIASTHIHPLYNNSQHNNYDHDIALIKLNSPIKYSDDVMPLCLPSSEMEYSSSLTGWVSGFGKTERSRVSRYLRYTSLPLVDKERCKQFVKNWTPLPFTENMFCAGEPVGGKDSCVGDAGGAFVLKKDDVFWAAGIVSWGPENCGEPGTYGVYTRVARYIDWINKTMTEN